MDLGGRPAPRLRRSAPGLGRRHGILQNSPSEASLGPPRWTRRCVTYDPRRRGGVRAWPRWGCAVAEVANVNELLDGHVGLDLECLDRVYLNAYVPNLQVSGQVVTFLCDRLGAKVPSPALFNKIGNGFRKAVLAFADDNRIPLVRFAKGDRKAEV